MLSLKFRILKEGIKLLSNELIKNVGMTTNLKLHDIAFNANTDDYNNHFEIFCMNNYDLFEEIEGENNTKREYVGNTSAFYIVSDGYSGMGDYYYMSDYNNVSDFRKKIMLINEFLYSNCNYITLYDEMSEFDDNIRGLYDNCTDTEIIEYITQEIKNTLIDDLKDINKTYDYIENFKANQLEYWNEEVSYWNEEN